LAEVAGQNVFVILKQINSATTRRIQILKTWKLLVKMIV
jgi:hypothetical protein